MPILHMKLPIVHALPNTFLFRVSNVSEHRDCQPKPKDFSYHDFATKKIFSFSRRVCALRVPPAGALQISVPNGETSSFFSSTDIIDSFSKQASNKEAQMVGLSDPADSPPEEDCKKGKRRKLKHGNKGKVPWNKGIKHSAETRVKIKQKTLEALSDPKVREKMAANPRPHSDESKGKIQSSLRQIWAKRLKWKRSREKVYHSWLDSIANYAKKGGDGEKELDWDSYDKIKQKIAAQDLRLAEKKAKAKEMSKQRRERAAQARTEKMARIAQRRKESEEREKRKRAEKRKAWRNLKKDEENSTNKGLKLKQMLTKIRKRKMINGPVTIRGDVSQLQMAVEDKLDIEHVKRERKRREVSLADQIQAARNRRASQAL